MIKNITLIARRADHSREAFRDHYEDVHAPLALRHIGAFEAYVRNHVAEELGAVPPHFDVATEFWFADGEAVKQVMDVLASPAGEEIRADERSFMDRDSITSVPVTERVLAGPGRDVDLGEARKVVAFLRRPEGGDADAFLEGLERGELPALLEAAPPLRCTWNRAIALPGSEPAFDGALMLWYAADGGVPGALADFRPAAGGLVLLRVTEHVTPRDRLRQPPPGAAGLERE